MGQSIITRLEHRLYIKNKRNKLLNKTPTIIADNCIGGIMYHDLGLRFNTPFINIGFIGSEYVKILNNLHYYLSLTPRNTGRELEHAGVKYPIISLGDVQFIFAHETDIELAIKKWEKRKQRVDYDNLYVFMSDSFNTTYTDILNFDQLPYNHKVVLTHKPLPEIKSAHYLKGFEKDKEVGILTDWKPGFWKRRYIDDFDYVSFLNKEGV